MTAIDENNFTSAGDTVASIIASAGNPDAITDGDADAVEGIAIFDFDSTNGTWEYSSDGGFTFTEFEPPFTSTALLLTDDAFIRFVPNAGFSGDASFSYRAWDQTTGQEGESISVPSNIGGTGSLSVDTDTATITVNNVDLPHQIDLNGPAAGENNTVTYTENDSFTVVAPNATVQDFGENDIASLTITGDVFDSADNQLRFNGLDFVPGEDISHTFSINGETITASTAGSDSIIISSSEGTDTPIQASSVQSIIQAFSFRSESDGIDTDDEISIQFIATDLAGQASPLVTSTISLIGVNDSPELDDTEAADFSSINEDEFDSGGTVIADILVRSVSDQDGDPEGIAIFNADQTNGKFEYLLEGANEYVAFGEVSQSSALLLDASTRIRFVPTPDYNGDATISFKAWDQTIGAEGDKIAVAGNSGGSNSLSDGDDTATITVNSVNDAPTIDLDADDSAGSNGTDFDTTFTGGGDAVLVTDGTALDDVDGTIETVTVSISDIRDGVDEVLSFADNENIVSNYDQANGLLTFTNAGSATNADFEQVLNSLTYENTSDTFDFTDRRRITFVANDGDLDSSVATTTVAFELDTDEPEEVNNTRSVVDEGGTVVITSDNLFYRDEQGPESTTYTVLNDPDRGFLAFSSAPDMAIDSFTQQDIDLGNLIYVHNGSETRIDQFRFIVIDAQGNQQLGEFRIIVNPVNDTPTANAPANLTATEQSSLSIDGAGFTVGDVDSEASDIEVVFNVTEGIISTSIGDSGVAVSNDAGTTTITGTAAEISDLLAGSTTGFVIYQNNSDSPSSTATLTMTVNDLGNTGADPGLTGDDASEIAETTTTINITPVNDAPNLTLSRISVDEGSTNNTLTNEDLIGTDVDDAPADLTYRLISTPSEGLLGFNSGGIPVVLSANDTFTQADIDSGRVFYNHSGSPALTDSFDLEFYDGGEDGAATRSGTFEIAINQFNEAPTAVNDNFAVAEDGALSPTLGVDDLLQNDSDPDGDTLTVNTTPVSGPTNGSLTLGTDGTFTYTPNADFNGVDSFTYEISDANGVTAEAIVQIVVDSVNDAPTTSLITLTPIAEDSGTRVITQTELLANAADVDGDDLTATELLIASGNGTLVDNGDGTWNYTPAANDDSDVSFSYNVTDGTDSVAGSVAFDITPVNDDPVAVDDFGFTTPEDTPITIAFSDLLANDSDADGDTLEIDARAAEINGIVQLNDDETFTFTPDADFSGVASFDYFVNDGNGGTDRATVEIIVGAVNDAPLAGDDQFTTSEDTPVTFLPSDLLANDSDADGDTLQVIAVDANSTTNGTLQVNGDGSYTYTPNANFFGSDSFTYAITDGNGGTDQATVNISITAVNDAPVLSSNTSFTVNENTTPVATFTGDDPDGDSLIYSLEGDDAASFSIDSSTGEVAFVSAPDFETPLDFDGDNAYEITVVATDDGVGTLSDRVDVTVDVADQNEVNETPTIDLNGDAPGTNLTQEFAAAGQPTTIFPNGTVSDFGENDIVSLTLNVTGFGDGVEERILVNGSEFQAADAPRSTSEVRNGVRTDSNYNSDDNTIAFTFTNSDPSQPISASDLQNVLQSIQFRNQGNSDSALAFEFEVLDASNQSSTANATLLVGDNNTPPTIGGFNEIRLADLTPSLEGPNASFTDNAGHNDAQITIDGQNYYNGIGLHPVNPSSFVEYDLNGATEFSAVIGLNDTLFQAGEVVFRAFVDGVEVFNSTDEVGGNVTNDTLALPISIDTTGGTTLRLVVETAGVQGADHAVFANAVLTAPTQVTTISVAESAVNGTLVGTYSGSDVDGDPLTYSLVDESGPFAIDADTGVITVADATQLDFETQSLHSIDVEIFDGKATVTDTLQIKLSNINEAPAGEDNTVTILEDGSRSFSVDDFGFSDPEGGELRSILVKNLPTGGTLTLNGEPVVVPKVIELADLPNLVYRPDADANGEDYDSFDFQVRDAGQQFSIDTYTLTFNVNPVNDDPMIINNGATVAEGSFIGISTALLEATDVDNTNAQLVYTVGVSPVNGTLLLNGNPLAANGTFTQQDIDLGNLTYQHNGTETTSDEFSFTVADGEGSLVTGIFNIAVSPVNGAPVFESGSNFSVNENETTSFQISATDPENDELTYNLLNDGDGELFQINSDGELSFISAPDFENPLDSDGDNIYEIVVVATDGEGLATEQNVSVVVFNVNEAPVLTADSAVSVVENTTAVGTFNGVDVDGDALTYSLVGVDAGLFTINSSTGEVTFATAPNFETPLDSNGDNVYEINVVATDDGGLVDEQDVTVTVINANEAPALPADRAVSVVENTTVVGTFAGVDPDGDTLTYSLVGVDAGLFTINSSTGEVTFAAAPDFETPLDSDGDNVYEINVVATDDEGLVSEQDVSVTVTNANEAPVLPADSSVSVIENATVVGTFRGIDPDGNTLNYSLTGDDAGLFSINSSTGEITFAVAPDFESPLDADGNNVYEITLVATDDGTGSLSDTQDIKVVVTNADENAVTIPVDVDAGVNQVTENAVMGTSVGLRVEASDLDSNSTVTYSLTNNPDGLFQIDANTGEVTTLGSINRELHGAVRSITVEAASDDGSTATASFDIAINDANEFAVGPVSDINDTVNAVNENAAVNTPVGIVANATDADATNNTVTYSLTNNDGGRFQIDAVTGEITVAGDIDFETDGESRNIVVRAEGADGSFSDQMFTIAINDINEAPTVSLTGVVFSLPEGVDTTNGIRIADILISDDALGTNELSLSGVDAGVFEIVGNELRLRSGVNLDFESLSRYDVNVEVNDPNLGGDPNDAVSHTLNVTDVDDQAPVIDPGQQFAISADSSDGTNVGTVTATDPDTVDPLVNWTIVGGNESGNFTIDSTTGVISVAGNSDLNFNDVATYELLIVVSDGSQNSVPETVVVNLISSNNAPVAQNDSFQVSQFDSVTVSGQGVLSNDSDSNGEGLTAQLVSPPDNGEVALNSDGSLVYTPNGSFVGVDSFTYQVFDGAVAGTIATVEIVVNPLGVSGDNPGLPNVGNDSNGSGDQNDSNESDELIESNDSNDATTNTSDNPTVVSSSDVTQNSISNVGSVQFNDSNGTSALREDAELSIDDEISLDELESNELAGIFRQSSSAQDRIELRFDHIARAAQQAAAHADATPIANLPLSVFLPGQNAESEESAEQKLEEIVSGTYVVSTATFSVGYVLWMIRGGSLLASFSSTLPVWTSFDPLAVVAADESDEEDFEDNESLIEIADANIAND